LAAEVVLRRRLSVVDRVKPIVCQLQRNLDWSRVLLGTSPFTLAFGFTAKLAQLMLCLGETSCHIQLKLFFSVWPGSDFNCDKRFSTSLSLLSGTVCLPVGFGFGLDVNYRQIMSGNRLNWAESDSNHVMKLWHKQTHHTLVLTTPEQLSNCRLLDVVRHH